MEQLVTERVFVLRSVRVFYEKTGDMKFISHLDINRFMIRMIKISKVPVWYSEGFNPHPYITFALPLSLGFESTYEIMDIRLDDDTFANELVFNSLKSVVPHGIKILKVCDPVMKAGEISSAEFVIEFKNCSDKLREQFFSFLNDNDEILIEKKSKKGKINTINISSMIYNFNFINNELKLKLAAGGKDNLNPKLLLDAFTKATGVSLPDYSIKRTMIFSGDTEFI